MAPESFRDPCIVLIASVRTVFSKNHCYSENVSVILSKCLNKVQYLFLNMYLRLMQSFHFILMEILLLSIRLTFSSSSSLASSSILNDLYVVNYDL